MYISIYNKVNNKYITCPLGQNFMQIKADFKKKIITCKRSN